MSSDKGREGIAHEIVGALNGADIMELPIEDKVELILSIFRDGGILHLDDVVEGEMIKEIWLECPDIQECKMGNTFRCPTGWASTTCRKYKTRQATVRDLTGKGD